MLIQQALKLLLKCLLLLCLSLFTSSAFIHAQAAIQTDFQRSYFPQSQSYQLSYQWHIQRPSSLSNLPKSAYSLQFSLPVAQASAQFHRPRQLSSERIARLLVRPLSQYAKQQGWHQMEISLSTPEAGILYHPHVRDQALAQQRVRAMQQQEYAKRQLLLQEHYLTQLELPPNPTIIIPDHPRIALISTTAVAAVSRAFYQEFSGAQPRQYVEIINHFIQAIPTQPQNNRAVQQTNSSGFRPPIQLLLDNQGNADSKVTLMAAILRNLMPNITMAIVYLPQHTLLALALNQQEGDASIEHAGHPLVLIDPSQGGVGQISEQSAVQLLHGILKVVQI